MTTPLALLHPRGSVTAATVMGSGCPPHLRPAGDFTFDGDAALVILAPSARECGTKQGLRALTLRALNAMASDGLMYVMVPARWRQGVRRLLRSQGLVTGGARLHLPELHSGRHLVPLARHQLRFAMRSLTHTARWPRRLAAITRTPGFGTVLGRLHPAVGFTAHGESSDVPMAWLRDIASGATAAEAIVTTSWRGPGHTTVVRLVDRSAELTRIIKVAPMEASSRLRAEDGALRELGPAARRSGLLVPEPTGYRSLGPGDALVQSALSGATAASLLARQPAMLDPLMERLAECLEAWARTTIVRATWDPTRVHEDLLLPARMLAAELDAGGAYLSWLEQRSREVTGNALAICAAHGDMTMSNLLIDGRGRLGLVDWEEARADGLPLTDFLYAAVDATMHANRDGDRVRAWEMTSLTHAGISPKITALAARLGRAVGIDATTSMLMGHACWLRHAVNEQRTAEDGGDRTFLEIVRRLARRALATGGT